MMIEYTTGEPARLCFKGGVIDFVPGDRATYFNTVTRASRASRRPADPDRLLERFESEFLVPVHDWCAARSGRVSNCYVTATEDRVRVFVVGTSPRFDFDLAEEVAALELSLARGGWRVGLMQLSAVDDPERLATFFRPGDALEVCAEGGRAAA